MYNNAKIKWQPGMELTAALFSQQEDNLDLRQKFAVRAALGDGRMGLLPGCEFLCEGGFVDRTYEINNFRCTAILQSGTILQVDDDLRIDIPKLGPGVYFICVGFSAEKVHEYVQDGIPYESPAVQLFIIPENEISCYEYMPVKRFVVSNGKLDMDMSYIPPKVNFDDDKAILGYLKDYSHSLQEITNHPNLEDGDGKRSLLSLFIRLNFMQENRWDIRDLLDLLGEVGVTVDYYLVDLLGKDIADFPEQIQELRYDERRLLKYYNLASYFQWLKEYLQIQKDLLDRVVIIDHSLDYEKLKAELRKELYDRIYQEILEKLRAELTEKLTAEISESLMNKLRLLMDELKTKLHDDLRVDLHDNLYKELLDELYRKLYDALYVPPVEETDKFIPLI